MHKKLILVLCISALIIGTGYSLAVGGEADEDLVVPTGYLTLEAPGDVEARRAPVDFPHGQHFDFKCMTCHHTWDKSAEINGCMTAGCHDLEKAPKNTKDNQSIAYYKKAFHTLCIGCHKEIKAKNKKLAMSKSTGTVKLAKTGPTGCVYCHPKE